MVENNKVIIPIHKKGDKWEHFVPEKVVEIIREIDGVKRLKTVAQSDQE